VARRKYGRSGNDLKIAAPYNAGHLPALPYSRLYQTYLGGSAVMDESSVKTAPQFDSHIDALTYRFFGSPIVFSVQPAI
jgi:hypothetical protein